MVALTLLYNLGVINHYEDSRSIDHSGDSGEQSIGPFALYWADRMTTGQAFASEMYGTFLLALAVFLLTSSKFKKTLSSNYYFPVSIGLILTLIINVIGSTTGILLSAIRCAVILTNLNFFLLVFLLVIIIVLLLLLLLLLQVVVSILLVILDQDLWLYFQGGKL